MTIHRRGWKKGIGTGKRSEKSGIALHFISSQALHFISSQALHCIALHSIPGHVLMFYRETDRQTYRRAADVAT